MHDVLYARQTEWEDDRNAVERFKTYAAESGLDREAFNRALEEREHAAAITAAVEDGRQQGISATPTYLVNGKRVNATSLGAAIEAALQAQGR